MSKSRVLVAACAMIFLAATCAWSAGDKPAGPPKPKGAATPEEAVQLLSEAAKAGNADAFLAQMADPVRSFVTGWWQMTDAVRAVDAAVDQKFGKQERYPAPTLGEAIRKYEGGKVLSKEAKGPDQVVLTLSFPKSHFRAADIDRVLAVKEGEHWKLLFPDIGVPKPVQKTAADGTPFDVFDYTTAFEGKKLDGPEMTAKRDRATKALREARQGIEQIAERVKAGKYTSPKAVKEAVDGVLFDKVLKPMNEKEPKRVRPV